MLQRIEDVDMVSCMVIHSMLRDDDSSELTHQQRIQNPKFGGNVQDVACPPSFEALNAVLTVNRCPCITVYFPAYARQGKLRSLIIIGPLQVHQAT